MVVVAVVGEAVGCAFDEPDEQATAVRLKSVRPVTAAMTAKSRLLNETFAVIVSLLRQRPTPPPVRDRLPQDC